MSKAAVTHTTSQTRRGNGTSVFSLLRQYRLYGFIVLVAAFLRFANGSSRWGVGVDQMNFALSSLHALRSFRIPLLGPFSSGGPFQTGGEWYWLVMLGYVLFPFSIYGPWMFMVILALGFVILAMYTGFLLGGRTLALVAGILSAVSTAQITQAVNLSNQTPISLFAMATLTFSLLYLREKRAAHLFRASLMVGIASAIHIQGIALVPVLAVLVLITRPSFRTLFLVPAGCLIPWLPVFLVDAQNNWYNTTSMFKYYTVGQYAVPLEVLGRNWRMFVSEMFPRFWGFTVGGYTAAGMVLMIVSAGFAALDTFRRRFSPPWVLIAVSFVFMTTMVRYAHVPLFESFVVFLHPFFILISAAVILRLIRHSPFLGTLLLITIIATSAYRSWSDITHSTNKSGDEAARVYRSLTAKFPQTYFTVYGNYGSLKTLQSYYFLYFHKKTGPDGLHVGIRETGRHGTGSYPVIYEDPNGTTVMDLTGATVASMSAGNWEYIDAGRIYTDLQEWYTKPR